jgi:carbon-monoxide dehydrogenase medium subunit
LFLKESLVYAFAYHRATGIANALARLQEEPGAKLMSGGMTLLPVMKLRLAAPPLVVDIAGLEELRGIHAQNGLLTVGAAMQHREVAEDEQVLRLIPALAQCARSIGDPQVRNRGTLGGSVANSDPAADYPAAVLGLQGVVVTDRRRIADGDYFLDMYTTALEDGELIKAIEFTVPKRAAYAKFANPASGYAMVGVFVAEFEQGGQRSVRVAVTGAAPVVFRWTQAEQALNQRFAVEAIEPLIFSPDGLNADLHASADYRAHLVKVMAMRAVADITGDAL